MNRRSFLKGLLAVAATVTGASKAVYGKTFAFFAAKPHPATLVRAGGFINPKFEALLRPQGFMPPDFALSTLKKEESDTSKITADDSWIADELMDTKGHPSEARLRAMVDYIITDERR